MRSHPRLTSSPKRSIAVAGISATDIRRRPLLPPSVAPARTLGTTLRLRWPRSTARRMPPTCATRSRSNRRSLAQQAATGQPGRADVRSCCRPHATERRGERFEPPARSCRKSDADIAANSCTACCTRSACELRMPHGPRWMKIAGSVQRVNLNLFHSVPEGLTQRARSFVVAHGVRADVPDVEQYRLAWLESGIPATEIDRAARFQRRWGGLVLPPAPDYDG